MILPYGHDVILVPQGLFVFRSPPLFFDNLLIKSMHMSLSKNAVGKKDEEKPNTLITITIHIHNYVRIKNNNKTN